MRDIRITIPIIPRAQKRARAAVRGKHAIVYKDAGQLESEKHIISEITPHRPDVPASGPVELFVRVWVPIPASWPAWKREAAMDGIVAPIGKPDLDNYLKEIKDCMTQASFWNDDSQVVRVSAEKRYSTYPRWEILMQEGGQPKTAKEYREYTACG